jgi:hypothetical protein
MLSENKKEFPFSFPFSAHRWLRPKFLKSADAPSPFPPVRCRFTGRSPVAQTAAHLLLSTAQLPKSARPPSTSSPAHLLTSFQPTPARIASPAPPQPARSPSRPIWRRPPPGLRRSPAPVRLGVRAEHGKPAPYFNPRASP